MLRFDMNFLYTMINLIVLAFLLKKFLIKPVTDIMEKRRQLIEDGLKRIVEEADARAGSIIESAKADIRVEREQTMSALQSEIAGLAMTAAAKIVAEQTGNNQEIYDKFLEEVGEAHEDTDNN